MCTSSTHCGRQKHQKASLDQPKRMVTVFGQAEDKESTNRCPRPPRSFKGIRSAFSEQSLTVATTTRLL